MKYLIPTTLLWLLSFFTHAQVITTIAGTGVAGYAGDNGLAINAKLRQPHCVILDKKGNRYIADFFNSAIRKIDTSGIITTIAGTGVTGYNGDSIPAITALLYGPRSIAIDDTGNIFVADYGNNRIRKIDTFGIIYTVAGTGLGGYNGDSIPAISAQLSLPYGVAVDTFGNIYIADYYNNRIRMVNTSGIITTIAGTGSSGFSGDDGPAVLATLYGPLGITIDRSGNVYFSDYGNSRVRKFNPDAGDIITTVAGDSAVGYSGDNVAATATSLNGPWGVTIDNIGNLYIGDLANNRVRKVNTSGIITTIAGNGTGGFGGDNGDPLLAELHNPMNASIGSNGYIFIADEANNRIRVIRNDLPVNTIDNAPSHIVIYPTPCLGAFKFLLSETNDEMVQVIIANMLGEQVREFKTATNSAINIQLDVPSGLYFISATTSHGKYKSEITVQ